MNNILSSLILGIKNPHFQPIIQVTDHVNFLKLQKAVSLDNVHLWMELQKKICITCNEFPDLLWVIVCFSIIAVINLCLLH